MSLKSGLLAESTWAIDALNILLYDDNTIAYFNLKHFPGLMNILIEHYLKCLKLIFNNNCNEFNDIYINDYETIFNSNQIESDNDEQQLVNNDHSKQQQEQKLVNGYHNTTNDESSTNKTKLNNHHNHNHHHSSSNNNNSAIDKHKIMKINFNDKLTRKKFLQYHKSCKYNDSKCLLESYKYNTKLLSKYNQKNDNIQHHNNSINTKELNNFIQTNLNTNDDIELLNKLFYGPNLYQQKQQQQEQQKNDNEHDELKHKNKKIKTNDNDDDENIKFIKLHQLKYSSNNNNDKSSITSKLYDDQPLTDEEQLFKLNNERNIELINRCIALSTIFRNLSFVPGNDLEMSKNNLFLKILSRLLIFKHNHKIIIRKSNNDTNSDDKSINGHHNLEDEDDDDDYDVEYDCIKELMKKNLFYLNNNNNYCDINDNNNEWWSECVQILRENTLVTISNISASINLNNLDEDIIQLYSYGLLHWSICKSQDAQDSDNNNLLTAQKLAIETLSKMSINDINIDLILTTMLSNSNMRIYIDMFINILCTEWLIRKDDQTNREFSIVLLTSLAKCDHYSSRIISKYISSIISYIEDFEEIARLNRLINPNFSSFYYQQHHSQPTHQNMLYQQQLLQQGESNINEDNLGTTIDMLRRCCNCLLYLSSYHDNINQITKYENRLLDLITSPFVDFKCSQLLTEVLYSCSSSSSSSLSNNHYNQHNNNSLDNSFSTSFKYSFLDPTIQVKLNN